MLRWWGDDSAKVVGGVVQDLAKLLQYAGVVVLCHDISDVRIVSCQGNGGEVEIYEQTNESSKSGSVTSFQRKINRHSRTACRNQLPLPTSGRHNDERQRSCRDRGLHYLVFPLIHYNLINARVS